MLGPHCIGVPASLSEFMAKAQPAIIKYLDPDSPELPRADITIGRIHWISEEKDMSDPLALAQRHADALSVRADKTGIFLWEGINEPPVWNGDDYIAMLCDYEWKRTEILNARGLGSVVLNLSVGWPREENGQIVWEPFRELLEDLPHGNYLGVHEYWLPMGPLHRDSLTHRTGRIFRCPYDVDILVTECGCDIGGGQGDGWRAQGLSVNEYITQLAQYRDLLATDARMKGATIFTYGNTGDWSAFDIEPDWCHFVPVIAWKPVTPVIETPIRVMFGGKVVKLELEEYLRGVVPAEMPALWEMEALKAQAVAARSYAMCRINNAYTGFDVYADARDQVYNPTMIHARSDRAARETKGDTIDNICRYVSKCGREDCPYCQGANGYDGKNWTGRMCQYGARTMAQNGATYHEILEHYYGGEIVTCLELFKDHATDEFAMVDGLVTGCRVDILNATAGPGDVAYKVVKLLFLNEEQARGDTRIMVSVLDRNGQATVAKVICAWPQQTMPNWDEKVYDWASPAHVAEFAQGGGNYDPAKDGPLGPYAIFIEQNQAKQPVLSDMCIGFGLPGNRHVGYQVVFQECVVGETEPTKPEGGGCNLILAAIANLIKSFERR